MKHELEQWWIIPQKLDKNDDVDTFDDEQWESWNIEQVLL